MAYWLFKTEPDVFSIDSLMAAEDQISFWDGVRNYQARNFLRDDTRQGDLVFIYHSSCKPPGITGVARIYSEPQVDPTQFQPESPYFDPASRRDNPRWFGVKIEFVEKFPYILPLDYLRAQPELHTMRLLQKGNRLSIMPVTTKEWACIMDLFR